MAILPDGVFVENKTKAWKDDPSKVNTTQEFSLDEKPTEIFELVKDLEDGYYSVHFKTTGKGTLTEQEKSKLIFSIISQLPAGSKISTYGDLTKGGLSGLSRFGEHMVESGETRSVTLDGKPIEIPVYKFPTQTQMERVTISSPAEYYKYKQPGKAVVDKVNNVARDLRPSNITYNVNGVTKNVFDFDSTRLRFGLNGTVSEADQNVINQFAEYFGISATNKNGLNSLLNK